MAKHVISIKTYLFSAFIACGIVPLLVLAFVLDWNLRRHAYSGAVGNLSVLCQDVSERIGEIMGGIEQDLCSVQSNPALRERGTRRNELNRLLGIYEQFYELAFYSPDGRLLDATSKFDDDPAPYQEHTEWFRQAVETAERRVSRPVRRLGIDGLFVVVYLPILGDEGDVLGVTRASVRFARVSDILRETHLGKAGHLILVEDSGLVLHDRDSDSILSRLPDGPGSVWADWQQRPSGNSHFEGGRWLFTSRLLPETQTRVGRKWYLVGLQSENEVFEVVAFAREIIFVIFCFAALLVTGSAAILTRSLAEPLAPVVRAARHVANKDWDLVRISPDGPREIIELSRSFNEMAEAIRSNQDQLEEKVAERTHELNRRKKQLASLNAQMRAAFESSLDGILMVGNDGKILSMNRRFREFFGVKDQHKLHISQLDKLVRSSVGNPHGFGGFQQDLELESSKLIDGRREAEWAFALPRERCVRVYSTEVSGTGGVSVGRLWVFHDVTETRDLESGLQQAQKMEAIGRLAGGIAHDFNNLLAGMMGNLELLKPALTNNTEAAEELQAAHLAASRASDLVRQILGVARKSRLNRKSCDANQLIAEVTSFMRHGLGPLLEIRAQPSAKPCRINVDASQLHQVLMNLSVNAKDAVAGKPGASITLSTHNLILEPGEIQVAEDSRPSVATSFVRIDVSDNGTGIPPEVLKRMFEPFFTTKGPGKGTGLGLATTRGIVEQHAGWVTCESRIGEGTTFHVFLPEDDSVCEEVVETPPVVVEMPAARKTGGETILLIDDELMVRSLNERYLKRMGYCTLTAVDGIDGLARFEQHRNEIDLVLLDLTMPNMSGPETFQALREICPDLPVIIYSGYVVDDEEFALKNGSMPDAVLSKPLSLDQLASEVRKALNRPRRGQRLAA